ncbi:hypothetical protein HDV01_003354 [Terramyces sp. JEL0728]|nr:hypothetical protein HDV01_003354 [Terramyces sp. JEL0728]
MHWTRKSEAKKEKQDNIAKPIKSESLIDQIKKKTQDEEKEEKSKKRKSDKSESPEKKQKVDPKPDSAAQVKKAIKSVLKKKTEFTLSEFKELVEKKLSKKDTKIDLDQVLALSFKDDTLSINI